MMNLQEEILKIKNEMIDEFDEKIKALKAEVQREDEFPQDGDKYWLIEETLGVSRYAWAGDDFDNKLLSVGNVFRTKQQAEFAIEKLKVEAELRKFSRPYKEGGYNYTLNYNHKKKGVVHICENTSFQAQGALYFESRDTLERAIESVGAGRIKKYIFGVEDLIND